MLSMFSTVAVDNKKPRVLLVENSLHTTGAFISAIGIAVALRDECDFEFVLPSTSTLNPKVVGSGFVSHFLPMIEISRAWYRLIKYVPALIFNTARLRRLLRAREIDILIINDYYNLLGFMVKISGWQGVLFTYVRLMPLNQHRLLNRLWISLGLWCSDAIFAVSHAVAAQLPISQKVSVLFDPKRFTERYPPVTHQPGDGLVRCLYLANYIAGKGHSHGLQAFAYAHVRNPALRLRFVGGDMDLEKNRALKASLERSSVTMGLGDVVTFSGFSNDVELEIKQADIVLNFSESESFSHTCMEACAFGRPIIATRCGGPEEIVEDGVSGFLVTVGDVPSMGATLILLSNDSALRDKMGQAGRSIVRDRFSEHRFVDDWHKIRATNL
jgi:glycosyltransferase involved in cell wall biosynthesis